MEFGELPTFLVHFPEMATFPKNKRIQNFAVVSQKITEFIWLAHCEMIISKTFLDLTQSKNS